MLLRTFTKLRIESPSSLGTISRTLHSQRQFSSNNNNSTDNKHVKPQTSDASKSVKSNATSSSNNTSTIGLSDITAALQQHTDTATNVTQPPEMVIGSLNSNTDDNTSASTLFTPLQASKLVTHNYTQLVNLLYNSKYTQYNRSTVTTPTIPVPSTQYDNQSYNQSRNHSYDTTTDYNDYIRSIDKTNSTHNNTMHTFYQNTLRHVLGANEHTDKNISIATLQRRAIDTYNTYNRLRKNSTIQRTVPDTVSNQLNTELNAQGIVLSTNTASDALQTADSITAPSTNNTDALQLDSVKRKRYKKMNRHKLKKRRKKERMMTRKSTT